LEDLDKWKILEISLEINVIPLMRHKDSVDNIKITWAKNVSVQDFLKIKEISDTIVRTILGGSKVITTRIGINV